MTVSDNPGIYLIVNFDWPKPFKPEFGQFAQELHDAVQSQDWISEALSASGGLGGAQSSVWIFWLENYAALDRLFSAQEDPVCAAYRSFFMSMDNVEDKVRQEIRFRQG